MGSSGLPDPYSWESGSDSLATHSMADRLGAAMGGAEEASPEGLLELDERGGGAPALDAGSPVARRFDPPTA